MTEEQKEYSEFWNDILNKMFEIQIKYSNLSVNNKLRADGMKNTILKAHNMAEAINIIKSQLR